MGDNNRRIAARRAGAAQPSPRSTPKQAIAGIRSSIVSINGADPTQPIGSGVIVRGRNEHDGIVATALHVVRDVPAEDLQIGFPVPPSEQLRGGMTMLGATIVATDPPNDLALLEMADTAPLTDGVPHPSGGRYPVTVAELEAERPEDGENVMISGFPLGYRSVLNSSGIIACAWGDHGVHEAPPERHREALRRRDRGGVHADVVIHPRASRPRALASVAREFGERSGLRRYGPAEPAGYCSSGTSAARHAASTGATTRHACSASSPPTDSALVPPRTSSRTCAYGGSASSGAGARSSRGSLPTPWRRRRHRSGRRCRSRARLRPGSGAGRACAGGGAPFPRAARTAFRASAASRPRARPRRTSRCRARGRRPPRRRTRRRHAHGLRRRFRNGFR
jgi:hypothetical protein